MTRTRVGRAGRAPRPAARWLFGLGIAVALAAAPAVAIASDSDGGKRGAEDAGSLLGEYFRRFLDDQDLEAFRDRVDARYSEASLCRLLTLSPGATTRRAAVLALGATGGFRRSNPVLGGALRDPDPIVRRLAEDALWSVWYRADTPEHNRALREVMDAAGRGDLDRAEALATRLIAVAPRFAEAYNQRAILAFRRNRFEDSARDCRRALELNPYHFGALGGLAQCELKLGHAAEAIEVLRRASRLRPYEPDIPDLIRRLEAWMAIDAP